MTNKLQGGITISLIACIRTVDGCLPGYLAADQLAEDCKRRSGER